MVSQSSVTLHLEMLFLDTSMPEFPFICGSSPSSNRRSSLQELLLTSAFSFQYSTKAVGNHAAVLLRDVLPSAWALLRASASGSRQTSSGLRHLQLCLMCWSEALSAVTPGGRNEQVTPCSICHQSPTAPTASRRKRLSRTESCRAGGRPEGSGSRSWSRSHPTQPSDPRGEAERLLSFPADGRSLVKGAGRDARCLPRPSSLRPSVLPASKSTKPCRLSAAIAPCSHSVCYGREHRAALHARRSGYGCRTVTPCHVPSPHRAPSSSTTPNKTSAEQRLGHISPLPLWSLSWKGSTDTYTRVPHGSRPFRVPHPRRPSRRPPPGGALPKGRCPPPAAAISWDRVLRDYSARHALRPAAGLQRPACPAAAWLQDGGAQGQLWHGQQLGLGEQRRGGSAVPGGGLGLREAGGGADGAARR